MEHSNNIVDQYFQNARAQDCEIPLEEVNELIGRAAEEGTVKRYAKQSALLPIKFIILISVGIAILIGGAIGIIYSTGIAVQTAGTIVLNRRTQTDTSQDTAVVRAWLRAAGSTTIDSKEDSLTQTENYVNDSGSCKQDALMVRPMPWTEPVQRYNGNASSAYADPIPDADAVAYQEFSASGNDILAFESATGRIKIIGYGGDKVTISVHLWQHGKMVAAAEPLFAMFTEGFALNISRDSNTISIHARKIGRGRKWHGATPVFTVYTPYRTACFINNTDCKVTVSGIGGTSKNITANGGIGLRDLLGRTDTTLAGEGITAKGLRGNFFGLSVTGSIELNDIDGTIDIATICGNIRLSEISGIASAETMHGSISAEKLSCVADLETVKGTINASISRSQGASIKMDGGPISLPSEQFAGTISEFSASGDINGGGPLLQLSTSGGSMVLVQK